MSYFKELDIMIQERSKYNPDTRENESVYLQLKDEINEHLQNPIENKLDSLSNLAKDILLDWENLMIEAVEKDFAEYNEHDGEEWA